MRRAHPDERCAAHLHRLDADGGVLDRRPADHRQLVRQPRLVDDLDAATVGREPDRPHRHPVDQHPPTVWTWPTPWTPRRSRTASGGAAVHRPPSARARHRPRTGWRGSRPARRRRPATATASPPATPRTSPALAALGLTHHRLSIEWARIEPEPGRRDTEAIEHYRRGAAGGPGRRHRAVGHAAPLHAARVVRGGRAGLRRRAGPVVLLAPPRRLHGRDLRRPRLRLEAGQRAVGLRAARLAARRCSRPGVSDAERFAEALEAIHLATFDAALRLRETGKPVASINNLSPVVATEPVPDVEVARDRLDHIQYGVWVEAVRDGILARAGPRADRARRVPDRLRPDRVLVLQRDVDRPGGPHRRLPGRRPARPDGLRAVERGPRAAAAAAGRGPARPAAPRVRARHRHRRRRLARGVPARVARLRRPGASPTASTSAGSSTGPPSTTTSGPTATRSASASSTQDRTPKPSTTLMRAWAQSRGLTAAEAPRRPSAGSCWSPGPCSRSRSCRSSSWGRAPTSTRAR